VEHERTERHPFHAQLLRGTLARGNYIAYLEQLFLLHQALLPALERAAVAHPGLVRGNDAQLSIECLKEDLDFLGGSTASTPLPPTRELVARIAHLGEKSDAECVGMHYVFEGSKNGGRFLARSIREAYALTGADGTRYLDPHGPEQPAHWRAFKETLDSVRLSEAEGQQVITGATSLFIALGQIATEILEARGALS
jgi:heme oxygenase